MHSRGFQGDPVCLPQPPRLSGCFRDHAAPLTKLPDTLLSCATTAQTNFSGPSSYAYWVTRPLCAGDSAGRGKLNEAQTVAAAASGGDRRHHRDTTRGLRNGGERAERRAPLGAGPTPGGGAEAGPRARPLRASASPAAPRGLAPAGHPTAGAGGAARLTRARKDGGGPWNACGLPAPAVGTGDPCFVSAEPSTGTPRPPERASVPVAVLPSLTHVPLSLSARGPLSDTGRRFRDRPVGRWRKGGWGCRGLVSRLPRAAFARRCRVRSCSGIRARWCVGL